MTNRMTKTIDGPCGPLEVAVDATIDDIMYAGMMQVFQSKGIRVRESGDLLSLQLDSDQLQKLRDEDTP